MLDDATDDTLKTGRAQPASMNVTVEVVGEDTHEFEVEEATYADLLAKVDLSPHEVSVMVDGRPVPEDRQVDATHVKVLRLIKGG